MVDMVDKDASFSEVAAMAEAISYDLRKRSAGIREYIDYPLCSFKLKRRYSEEELEKKLDIWFCNGLLHDIDTVTLVYCAYDGVLGIVPEADEGKFHDSYMNVSRETDPLEFDQEIHKLWQRLLKL